MLSTSACVTSVW